jgi:hypothetical protein
LSIRTFLVVLAALFFNCRWSRVGAFVVDEVDDVARSVYRQFTSQTRYPPRGWCSLTRLGLCWGWGTPQGCPHPPASGFVDDTCCPDQACAPLAAAESPSGTDNGAPNGWIARHRGRLRSRPRAMPSTPLAKAFSRQSNQYPHAAPIWRRGAVGYMHKVVVALVTMVSWGGLWWPRIALHVVARKSLTYTNAKKMFHYYFISQSGTTETYATPKKYL